LWLAKAILRLILKKEFTEESPSFTKMDLDFYITEGQGGHQDNMHDVDTDILRNALEFGNVKVRDCMVPRTELVCVEHGDTIENLEKLFIESGHSKVLVYKDHIDHIIGYVHHVDMFKRPESIQSILIPILITNESRPVNELLNDFTLYRKSIALVVDEFGGTAGIVTTEDIIEEIFGEIEDEHDENSDIIERKISDFEYELSAKLEVDYLNNTYNLHLPTGEYDTLGGFIMAMHESIPEEGETVIIEPYEFKVLSSHGNKLETVHLRIRTND
jgi:CBS domain containing-hemolysin-like protein